MKSLEDYIVTIPDVPKPGVMFRDVTSVLKDPDGFRLAIDELTKLLDGIEYDVIAGVESRGFLIGAPIAYNKKKSLVPIRKKGKLPREVYQESYDLEYGSSTLEIHRDAISAEDRVLVVDDLIATGGTIRAAINLIQKCGGRVLGATFAINLADLGGARMIERDFGIKTFSVLNYEGA